MVYLSKRGAALRDTARRLSSSAERITATLKHAPEVHPSVRSTSDVIMEQRQIRLATAKDLPGILTLYKELRPHDPELPTAEAMRLWSEILENRDVHVFVSDIEGQLASSCMLAVVPNLANGGRPFGIIEHVITLFRFRRRGLAQALLEFALSFAWSRRCYKVVLLSGVQRLEAHKMYEAVGFRGDIERGFVAKPTAPPEI
ncbi:MAG: GNAT family N-acetyltransferase [Sulfurifustis sp.]